MSLFSFDGCAGHHYETVGPTGRYRIRYGTEYTRGGPIKTGFQVEKEVREGCEHDGCNASRTEWQKIRHRVKAEHSEKHDTGRHRPWEPEDMVKTDWFSSESKARYVLAAQVDADRGVIES